LQLWNLQHIAQKNKIRHFVFVYFVANFAYRICERENGNVGSTLCVMFQRFQRITGKTTTIECLFPTLNFDPAAAATILALSLAKSLDFSGIWKLSRRRYK
jgi:hypothetical protein